MENPERNTDGRYASETLQDRRKWRCAAIGSCNVAFGLSVVLLLMQFTHVGPLAANAAGLVCLTVSLRFLFAAQLSAANIMNLSLVLLMAYVANALILATLLHSTGVNPPLAQLAAITAYTGLLLGISKLFVFSDLGREFLDRSVLPLAQRPWAIRLGFVAALVASLAYIAARTVLLGYNANDFRYFWLAGDLWAQGLDPYDTKVFTSAWAVHARGEDVFSPGANNPVVWPYPPWVWVIARTAAMFPFAEAQVGWRLLLAAMLVGSVLFLGGRIARSAARDGMQPGAVWYGIAMLLLTCTMRASGESLSIGQTSHLVLLGLMLALVALLEERQWMGVVAMVLLAMKPQIGLVFGLFMMGTLRWFRVVVIAGIIVALLAVPPILVVGVEPTIGGFLNGLSLYDSTPLDQAVGMTGLRHLAFQLIGVELSAVAFALAGGVIVLLIGYFLYRGAADAAARRHILGLVLLVIVNFAPLHAYETVYVMPVILLMMGWPALVQLSIGVGLLILYRSDMIANATGWTDPRTPFFYGTSIDSAGFLILLLVWVTAIVHDHRAKRRSNQMTLKADTLLE